MNPAPAMQQPKKTNGREVVSTFVYKRDEEDQRRAAHEKMKPGVEADAGEASLKRRAKKRRPSFISPDHRSTNV